ncbi:hypothetical protein PT7_P004 (plasmid) [Pusillimonas sp. T7-7]|nr:hypothetical protein PT7_P004 [Pusillimonas sp. T7-7]
MDIILFWFLFAIAVGIWANNRGRNGFAWFLLAAIISPILAAVFLAASSNLKEAEARSAERPSPATHVVCPDCAEFVRKEARVCKHCGCRLTPVAQAAPETVGNTGLTPRQITGIILALLLAYAVYESAQI